ncbi:hypothetical protein G9A89_012782 [Geosiphon pyriformis]|nr:hypothetical protein G9A89_012782 [Geosiphon pyriformis]
MQRNTSVEIIDSEYQKALILIHKIHQLWKLQGLLYHYLDLKLPIDYLEVIANTSKKTVPHRRAADFSLITANKLEEKANKKYRHIGRLSVKGLTEKFIQISEENLPETTSVQTNNFVLQPIFNKGGNSNKFQMEA